MDFSEFHSADFKQFVQDHLREDPALLLLKFGGKVSFDLKEAVQQISARQKASKKLPEWTSNTQIHFPASISLEQSSSEETARIKAKSLSGDLMIDLTGGLGVDSFYLSQNYEKAIYCEQQPDLFEITRHNLNLLSPSRLEFFKGDGLQYLKDTDFHFDLIYADPARRGKGNQKLYKIQDCEPDLVTSWDLLKSKADQILLKYSPMLDISQAFEELPDIQKITILSVKNEVKELLLHWKKKEEDSPRKIQVQDLGKDLAEFVFDIEHEPNAISQFGEAEKYLIEPISGILKAGAFKLFGERFSLKKLDTHSHLYTTSELPEKVPGRIFKILEVVPLKKTEFKSRFPKGKVNVLFRNYASKPEDFKKKFGLKDGGEEYLIGTKSQSGYQVFRCERVQ